MEQKRKIKSVKAKKNEKAYSTDEVKRYLGSLAEDFQGKVSAIGEQFGGINKKLDSHTEMIGGIKEDIEIIKINIEFLKGDVKVKVDYADFAALEKRLRLVESKLHR